jgi:hypothetical protein
MSKKRKRGRRGKQEAGRPRRRRPSRDERVLRERIQKFTYQERFATDFQRALREYFDPGVLGPDGTLTVDQREIPAFQEWYIFDRVSADGERIIDLFAAEVGPRLPAAQQEMLDDWRETNRLRLFEVQAVQPGTGLTVQDLLSGEIMEVNDISASHSVRKWQVMLARPLRTEGRLHFTGAMVPLTPMQKPQLLQCARELWEEAQAQYPEATLSDFYCEYSLDLLRCQEEALNPLPSEHVTPEGHPLVRATARYTVIDAQGVQERLDEAKEFLFVGPADEDETADAYVWVLTGRSHVPEVPIERGVIHRSEWISESGDVTYRSLGDVRLWPDRLALLCLSRERLAAGKALLGQILGRRIRHVEDEYRDLEDLVAPEDLVTPEEAAPGAPPEVDPETARRTRERVLEQWLDTPQPNLAGKTPREAARDPDLAEEVDDMLKSYEYLAEDRRREGVPYLDVDEMRRKLGR